VTEKRKRARPHVADPPGGFCPGCDDELGIVVNAVVQDAADDLLRRVTEARPVVTTCPVCRRPNPCPLHSFSEQVAHYRERGQ
jgi:hypothetical protein